MATCWQKNFDCFLVPFRYVTASVMALVFCNIFTSRLFFSMIISDGALSNVSNINVQYVCSSDGEEQKKLEVYFDWDDSIKTLMLSSFYWGYVALQLPAGIISDQFGCKYLIIVALLLNVIIDCLCPQLIILGKTNWWIILVTRVARGLISGLIYPAMQSLLIQWIAPGEMHSMICIVSSGPDFGTSLAAILTTVLPQLDFSIIYYVSTAFGVFTCIMWQIWIYTSTKFHPCISREEKEYLEENQKGFCIHYRRKNIPWGSILSSRPLWALGVVYFGSDWIWYIIVTELPIYMKNILKSYGNDGFYTSIIYFANGILKILIGFACDWLVIKGHLTITFARKIFMTIGTMGPAFFIIIGSYSGCSKLMAFLWFGIGISLLGFRQCGIQSNVIDLAPNYAGIILGLINAIAAIGGIIAPYVVVLLTSDATTEQWTVVFWFLFFVSTMTNLIFIIFCRFELQKWNSIF